MLNDLMKKRLEEAEKTLLAMKKGCDELSIQFFPIHGTLLGMVRDGHLIPWDTDVDLATFSNPEEIGIKKIIDTFNSIPDMKVNVFEGPISSKEDRVKIAGLYVDSFWKGDLEFWSRVPDTGRLRTFDGGIWCPSYYFDKFRKMKYLETEFDIPFYAEDFLKWNYGDNWKIPARFEFRGRKWLECDENGQILSPVKELGVASGFFRR